MISETARIRLLLFVLPPCLVLWTTHALETPLDYIDTWIYYGFFLNLSDYKETLFTGTYYGERLGWLLPGHLIHSLADPPIAQAVLRIGLLYSVAVSHFLLLKRAFGARAALVGTIVLVTGAPLTAALGTDYVDVPGVAYNLIALACAVQGAHSPHPRRWLIAAGAATVAMVSCNLFLLAMTPTIPAAYLYFCKPDVGARSWTAVCRTYAAGLLALGAGCIATTALFSAINYSLDGRWLFLRTSMTFARSTVGRENRWDLAGTDWLAGAYWLVIPAAVLIVSGLALFRRRELVASRPPALGWYLHALFVWIVYAVWDLAHGFAFDYREYVSFMMPSTFLALGALIAPRVQTLNAAHYWTLVVTLCLTLTIPYPLQPFPLAFEARWTVWLLVGAVTGLTLLVFRTGIVVTTGALAILVAVHAGIVRLTPEHSMPSHQRAEPDALRRVHTAAATVMQKTNGQRVYFWYDRSEPRGLEFHALHSTFLYEYSSLHYSFPDIPPQRKLTPGMQVVLLSSRPIEQVMSMAARSLAALSMRAELLDEVEIRIGSKRFLMIFLRLDRARREPVTRVSATARGGTSFIPARRATRIDPVELLRNE